MVCLCILLSSCEKGSESGTEAFIGGEIVNPKSNFVLLSQQGKLLDSIRLDSRNRFGYNIQNVEQGFYLLEHRGETQNIYLSPGDSLLLRANTLAFDESLHFSGGSGYRENNFLTELFLLDEQNAELLLSFYKVPPAEFAKKTDSIRQARLLLLKSRKNFSEDFRKRATTLIDYGAYDLRERYSYLIQKYYRQYLKQFPDDFYNYRQSVDYNLKEVQATPAYRRFIDNRLVNYSLEWCAQSGRDAKDCSNLLSHDNILQRLQKANELIQLPELREHFLSKLGVLGIITSNTKEEIDDVLSFLKKHNYPEEDLEEIIRLSRVQMAYLPGTPLSEVEVQNFEGELVSYNEITDQPSIIFLWSIYSKDHQEYHKLIQELRGKYPEIEFLGINMDVGEVEKWKTAVRRYGYNTEKEFQLQDSEVENEIFKFYLNKLLFLDSEGKVVVGDVFINSPDLENRILEFLNP